MQQEFDRNRIGGCGAGGSARPAGIARLVSGSSSSSIASAGFMVATMLVPDGVTAAAAGSSVIWKIVVAPSKIAAWPSTWKVKTGAPITTTRSCSRSASTAAPARRAGSRRIADAVPGNEQRAENGLTQTAALAFSATRTIRSTASARSTPGPTTRAGRLLADERRDQRLHRCRIGPDSRLTWRASTGCVGRVQSSIGTETKVGPQGGCIAT